MSLIDSLCHKLNEIDMQGLRRQRRITANACAAHMQIDGRTLISFAGNDYLGLAAHPALAAALIEGVQRYGAGSGGSHLLGGHSQAHAQLEETLAAFAGGFVDAPRALFFSTGYMANLATLTALATPINEDAALFSDALNHASLIDGARLCRAHVEVYPHCNTDALEALLKASKASTKLIVSDTLFSMDGDIAPLAALLKLAERYNAWLIVDDAHGFGVLGPQGRGAIAQAALRSPHLVYLCTFGKAAGLAGAAVIAHEKIIEWLIQRARPYIFTTASPPAIAHAILTSLRLIASPEGDTKRAHLAALIAHTRTILKQTCWRRLDSDFDFDSDTAIQPLIIGSNQHTLAIAAQLDAQGVWVPAIRPPTVPKGTSRLRISLSAGHSDEDLSHLADALNSIELESESETL